jgi:glycosyltransferase involved in cell wall biosynthesis
MIRCLHLVSGDLWAGAEVSAFELMREISRRPEQEVAAVVFNEGTLQRNLGAAGIATWLVSERHAGLAQLVTAVHRIAREFSPDVIHTHRYKEHLIGALVATLTGAKHVRSAHGLSPAVGAARGRMAFVGMLDEALSDWTGSTWIVVSEDLRRRLEGVRRSIHVVPNGISAVAPAPDRATLLAALGPAQDDVFVLGFVGRLERVKRPDRFLRMLAALPERSANRRFVGAILGSGSMRGELERLAVDLGLGERVRFLGHRDHAQSLIAALDALVLTSDHEGLPMVLLEAMRSGTPVVATSVGGVPEVLGPTPWTVLPTEEARLASIVAQLAADDRAREEWSAALTTTFRSKYTIAAAADRVSEVYSELLGPR